MSASANSRQRRTRRTSWERRSTRTSIRISTRTSIRTRGTRRGIERRGAHVRGGPQGLERAWKSSEPSAHAESSKNAGAQSCSRSPPAAFSPKSSGRKPLRTGAASTPVSDTPRPNALATAEATERTPPFQLQRQRQRCVGCACGGDRCPYRARRTATIFPVIVSRAVCQKRGLIGGGGDTHVTAHRLRRRIIRDQTQTSLSCKKRSLRSFPHPNLFECTQDRR
mmetsp:Transcript_12947/g.42695  ORF Transcript_12947/g.42695 Transcript_12947/m.42695 type:complete len:224 (-) Transcript_12947:2412-3083(-)